MTPRITSSLSLTLSLLLSSCAKDSPPAPMTGWAVGWSNDATYVPTAKILKTVDGGVTWALQALPAATAGFSGNDISAVNEQVAWAAAGSRDFSDGGVLHTGDGGATWAFQPLPAGMASVGMKNIKGLSPTEAWAASIQGDVLHTTDGGAHWTLVPVTTAGGAAIAIRQVNRMDVAGRDVWIIDGLGLDTGVVHSQDGGATWRREQLPGMDPGRSPLTVTAFDGRVAWAAVNQAGYLWGTTDGGATWNKSIDFLAGAFDYDDICASNAGVVWVALNTGPGGLAARITVTDGHFASNPLQIAHYTMEGISAMPDDLKAWAVGQKPLNDTAALPQGAIFVTSDGGVTWHQQALPSDALEVQLWKVSFVGARR